MDQSLAVSLTTGSNRMVEWRCPDYPGTHRWSAVVASRVTGSGCPICAGRRVLAGFNDLATVRPEIAALLVDPQIATRVTVGSNRTVDWRCDRGHTWSAKIESLTVLGQGCPYCAGRRVWPGFNDMATTHSDLAVQLVDPELATRLSAGSGKKVQWRCPADPRHVWTSSPNARTAGRPAPTFTGCPVCSGRAVVAGVNDLATVRPDLAAQLADPQPDGSPAGALATRLRPGSNRIVTWTCEKHAHRYTWAASPNNRRSTGCPVCSQRVVVPGLNDLATTHPELVAQLADIQPDGTPAAGIAARVSRGSHEIMSWICGKGHAWTASVKDRVRGTGCPVCACSGTSVLESGLIGTVRALAGDRIVVEHGLLAGRTGRRGGSPSADVVVPGSSLAVEFNGLYWHSEAFIGDHSHHRDKSRLAEAHGLRLVHVWEDEWLDRRVVVVRELAHRLGCIDRLPEGFTAAGIADQYDPLFAERLSARSMTVTEVSRDEATAFLRAHHVQGPVSLSRGFGLTDDQGRLRALIGLRSPRSNARAHRGDGEWEIQRYATYGLVRGGFTRLLAHAERILAGQGVPVRRWISFSDDGLSDGGLYRKAGFRVEARIRPDYRYTGGIVGRHRVPKERFQLRRFRTDDALTYEEGWTEHEAALANGLFRIYDAGKTRWVKDVM